MERGKSLLIFKVKGHISRSLDGYLGYFYMVQIKLLIQAENIYVGRMLLHSVLLLLLCLKGTCEMLNSYNYMVVLSNLIDKYCRVSYFRGVQFSR